MLFTSVSTAVVALSVFAHSAAAWPSPPRPQEPNLDKLATIMPQSTLPPPTNLKLKYVLLGLGTQNYTCLTNDETVPPDTTGAVAKLYDIGTELSKDPGAKAKISTISGLVLNFYAAAAGNKETVDRFLKQQKYAQWLGDHYFTGKVPTFSLTQVKSIPFPRAMVVKKNEADAPKTACKGTKNEGAIKWLQLGDDGNSQGGINTVYRIETAGGNKPAVCKGQPKTFEVPYAAQYWVYGPK